MQPGKPFDVTAMDVWQPLSCRIVAGRKLFSDMHLCEGKGSSGQLGAAEADHQQRPMYYSVSTAKHPAASTACGLACLT